MWFGQGVVGDYVEGEIQQVVGLCGIDDVVVLQLCGGVVWFVLLFVLFVDWGFEGCMLFVVLVFFVFVELVFFDCGEY